MGAFEHDWPLSQLLVLGGTKGLKCCRRLQMKSLQLEEADEIKAVRVKG